MCAKYGRSRINDVHTISPSDSVSLPVKVVRSTAFFSKKKTIFVRLLSQPLAGRPGTEQMDSCIYINIIIAPINRIWSVLVQQLYIKD